MDYHELAHAFVMELICRPHRDRHTKSDEFSRGETKMIGFLFAVGDGITAGELSEKLDVSTARVAMILNNLEKKGLIQRDEDAQDKRKVVVFLTLKGKETGMEDFDKMLKYMAELFRRLGEKDALEYIRIKKKVAEITKEIFCGE